MVSLVKKIEVPAGVGMIWNCWTTVEGVKSFFAPQANIELRVGGLYEIFFFPENPAGERGADGMHLLELEPEKYLTCTGLELRLHDASRPTRFI